jgi:hypothetical protein
MRATFLCLLLVAPVAYGEVWIALASLDTRTAADEARDAIAGRIEETLTVSPAETRIGTRYRVLIGPYASRATAEAGLERVRAAGFGDAWLYDSGVSAADTSSDLLFDDEPIDSASAWSGLDDLPPTSPTRAPASGRAQDLPKLVTEAPPGYELNRLHRN